MDGVFQEEGEEGEEEDEFGGFGVGRGKVGSGATVLDSVVWKLGVDKVLGGDVTMAHIGQIESPSHTVWPSRQIDPCLYDMSMCQIDAWLYDISMRQIDPWLHYVSMCQIDPWWYDVSLCALINCCVIAIGTSCLPPKIWGGEVDERGDPRPPTKNLRILLYRCVLVCDCYQRTQFTTIHRHGFLPKATLIWHCSGP